VQSENIVSIELAVGAAALVLGARLFSLIQATRGVPEAHGLVVEALAAGDLNQLRRKTQGLGYRNPYGDVAIRLIEAHERDANSPQERAEFVERAAGIARRKVIRRTQQSQAMDLVALSVGTAIVVFAREGLPAGPLFWSLAAVVLVFLISCIAARSRLETNVLGSLDALRTVLIARPQLPSLSDGPLDCFWCGEKTEKRAFDITDVETDERERVLAAVCGNCGKFVTTLQLEEIDSSVDPVSS
jgi:hypothetical protein